MVLETDHAEIGAQILTQWSFPTDVVNTVRFHHNPDIIHNKDVRIDLVCLANMFCQMNGGNGENSTDLNSISPALRKRLGFEKDKLESFSNQISAWAKDFSAKLTFDL